MALFQKGQIANPGGRTKKDIELEEHARLHAKEALDVLIREMRCDGNSAGDRIRAANTVIERAYGKPKEQVTLTHVRTISERPDTELEAIIAAGGSGAGIAEEKAGASKPDRVH